jgi:hypothetical protein
LRDEFTVRIWIGLLEIIGHQVIRHMAPPFAIRPPRQ